MEYDFNTPWYRPTRVCHVVSGAEYGWRNGAGKRPEWYPDNLPPVFNIGPGSPTGMTFGYGATPAEGQQLHGGEGGVSFPHAAAGDRCDHPPEGWRDLFRLP